MDANKLRRILKDNNYKTNPDLIRRINWYSYTDETIVLVDKDRIVVSTELAIKGVYNVMIIYPDGKSEVEMKFDK